MTKHISLLLTFTLMILSGSAMAAAASEVEVNKYTNKMMKDLQGKYDSSLTKDQKNILNQSLSYPLITDVVNLPPTA